MQLPHNLYDRARLLGAAGVEATIRLNPTGWSTRLRNAVVKSLRSGTVNGGERSKVRTTCELILRSRGMQSIDYGGYYVAVRKPLTLPADVHDQALQLLRTEFAVARLSDTSDYALDSRRTKIEQFEGGTIGARYRTHFQLKEPYCKEFASLLAAGLPEEETKERNKLADDIVAGRTITIQE